VQGWFRTMFSETHEAAAELLGDQPFELWPLFGMSVGEAINALAADQRAELIVFGSPHHGRIGRVLLGNSAAAACEGAPCAVAVAPAGYRRRSRLSPPVIGVAHDGTAESAAGFDAALTLARDLGASVRVHTVEPGGLSRPIHQPVPAELDFDRLAVALAGDVDVETWRHHGDPVHILARESERLGLLVCGSRARGPLRRVMLGSVSAALLRSAACPVVVVPRRVVHPTQAPQFAALSHH
jgi:nucleotide-binding universal stress UspA family protein